MSPEAARVLDLLEDMADVLTGPRPRGDAIERLTEYARRLGAVESYVQRLAETLGADDVAERIDRSRRGVVDEILGDGWRVVTRGDPIDPVAESGTPRGALACYSMGGRWTPNEDRPMHATVDEERSVCGVENIEVFRDPDPVAWDSVGHRCKRCLRILPDPVAESLDREQVEVRHG